MAKDRGLRHLDKHPMRKMTISVDLQLPKCDIATTKIYSHLRHDFFAEKAFDAVTVDLSKPAGDVVSISRSSGPLVPTMGTAQEDNEERKLA
jgi:hypothetical protein